MWLFSRFDLVGRKTYSYLDRLAGCRCKPFGETRIAWTWGLSSKPYFVSTTFCRLPRFHRCSYYSHTESSDSCFCRPVIVLKACLINYRSNGDFWLFSQLTRPFSDFISLVLDFHSGFYCLCKTRAGCFTGPKSWFFRDFVLVVKFAESSFFCISEILRWLK